ncbi:polymorphic toxin-type HINT domain-containing protein [Streptomyces sp. NPDC059849]|uniref:polymorphic toxin-type HINT domain-containing protein n=1 Tax=Streptomyces sp. NPDC059849 TaxID=3346969 RepID=UPI00365952D7
MGQFRALEISENLFHVCMIKVYGLGVGEPEGAVGEDDVVAPDTEQLALPLGHGRGVQPFDTPHDEAGRNVERLLLGWTTTYTDPTGNNPVIAACAVGGLVDGGLDRAFQRLSGRKVNWGQVGNAALTVCMMGMAGEALSAFMAARRTMRLGSCLTGNSFTADTPVLMADGTSRPIKDIKTGDKVLAIDPQTGETGPRAVTALIEGNGEKQLVDLAIDTGQSQNAKNGSITTTEGHPFWVPALHQWIQASAGTWVQITATKQRAQSTNFYNLTVDDLHTHYVLAGQTPVLVHNSNCWTIKARMRAAGPGERFGLPNQGRIRYEPPKGYNAANPLPRGRNGGYVDRFGNEWTVSLFQPHVDA